jgi:isocitrate dehydrogenase
MPKVPVSVAHGDGVGPEIMAAVLQVLEAAGAEIDIEPVEIGSWEPVRRTQVLLKSPLLAPLSVAMRKTLGLYANVRPCVAYDPFIETRHPQMDVVIVRENEEDLYAGIEYRISAQVMESLKLISRPGCERIVRYAFEYARRHNRRRVACFTKDNVLQMTDGLFHRVFAEIAVEYPQIKSEHWAIDIGAAKLADTPEAFDVVVLPNLYGDILSEVAAELAGSVGFAAAANIGERCAMFEAVQGAAPRQAGKNLANPSGLILASVLMLVHIDQPEAAERVHNAWLRTIEDGVHTYDVFTEGVSTQKVGTREFACAVIARMGQKPCRLQPASYGRTQIERREASVAEPPAPHVELVGVDVYVEWPSRNPNELGEALARLEAGGLSLQMLTNRGVRVWPGGLTETICTDSFRCRFLGAGAQATRTQVISLLEHLDRAQIEVTKTEYLRRFNGQPGFSPAQGE